MGTPGNRAFEDRRVKKMAETEKENYLAAIDIEAALGLQVSIEDARRLFQVRRERIEFLLEQFSPEEVAHYVGEWEYQDGYEMWETAFLTPDGQPDNKALAADVALYFTEAAKGD